MKWLLSALLISTSLLSAELPKNGKNPYDMIKLNSKNVDLIFNSSRPVIVDVYSDSCSYCKRFLPIFNEVGSEYGDLYQFAKLNIRVEDDCIDLFRVTSVPTIIFMKNGKEVGRQTGFMTKEKFLSKIKLYL